PRADLDPARTRGRRAAGRTRAHTRLRGHRPGGDPAGRPTRVAGGAVGTGEIGEVDMVVCGSVAVNRIGVRIGKGAGYSDLEVALLVGAGLVGAHTTIVTTVHDLQVVPDDLPEAEYDVRVDLIVTPTEVIACRPARRRSGIVPGSLTRPHLRDIPVLAALVADDRH